MRPIPGWLLKLGAGGLTALAAAGSAAYVSSHVKSGSAPLHPAVAASSAGFLSRLGIAPGGSQPSSTVDSGGHLVLSPSVEASDNQQPLTFTSVS